jgi:uncharacterized damage-inducible protein DinB
MTGSEGKRLAEFSIAVRESTMKRLRLVPEGYENWRFSAETMSFADLAQHLIDADNWLFEMLRTKNMEPIVGKPHLVEVMRRDQYLSLLDELEQVGARRAEKLESITDTQLSEMIFDCRFGREVSAWWIILRGNLDHEIHHRGQIIVYLRVINQKK